jgi:glycerol-1-phosphate dehydrogenase [NAD(P)+]
MHIWPIPKIIFMPLHEIEERRDVALITSRPAWQAVHQQLHLPVVWEVEVTAAVQTQWNRLAAQMRGEVIYAVGGGLVADAAKYLAAKSQRPLVCLPTALSVDAFLTWASGVRQDGCVVYIETQPPDRLLVDFEVIAAAPPSLRAAGICDVLSIATGSWDWRLAEEKGLNPPQMAYSQYVDRTASAILQGALDCAEAAGLGDFEGLKQLLDCLALEVQLCNQIGHSRPEEGSEHYFAYALENELDEGLPHGDLVGPGILLMLAQQGQKIEPFERALRACDISLDRIPEAIIESTLRKLPDYVRRHNLPYSIAHEIDGSI